MAFLVQDSRYDCCISAYKLFNDLNDTQILTGHSSSCHSVLLHFYFLDSFSHLEALFSFEGV